MSTDLPSLPDPADVALDAVEQQELFGARVFGEEDLSLLRGARRYAHTGTTVARDEQRAKAIGAAKLLGWSNRRVAREMHCDIRIVGLVVRELETAGKLPALKDRLQRAVGEVAELTAERLHEMLERGESLDPELAGLVKSLWVGLGIGSDKLAAPAPTLHLHQHVHQGSGLDAAREYAARLANLRQAVPVDSVSTGPAMIGAESGHGAVAGAACARLDSAQVVEVVAAGQADLGQPAGALDPAGAAGAGSGRDPRGGGCARRDGRPCEDGFPRGDFEANGPTS